MDKLPPRVAGPSRLSTLDDPDARPRDVLLEVVKRSPKASEAAHRDRFREAILTNPRLMADLAHRYFSSQYRSVLRQRRPKAEKEAQRRANEAQSQAEGKAFQDKMSAWAQRHVRASLADLPLANGKRLGDCTPEEMAALSTPAPADGGGR